MKVLFRLITDITCIIENICEISENTYIKVKVIVKDILRILLKFINRILDIYL